MQAFIQRIILFIISVILPFLNIPIEIEPIIVESADIEIIDSSHGLPYSSNGYQNIFFCYDEFMLYCNTTNKSNNMKEYAKTIDREFFKHNNLVIIDVTRAASNEKVFLKSAEENGTTLSVAYSLVSDMRGGLAVICYDSICVKTSKLINKIEITSREKVHLPFCNIESSSFFSIVDAEKNNPEEEIDLTYVFKDYESWQNFFNESDWRFYGYTDQITEELFENNNLGLVFSPIGNSATETRIGDFDPMLDEMEMELTCYNIIQPSVGLDIIGYNAIFLKVSKETESIKASYIDYSVSFMLDGTQPMR